MSDEPLVTTERLGRVLVITLCRPAKRNAVNRALAEQVDAALNQLDDDGDLWAGVLAAEGPVFCAGTDLAAGEDCETERGGPYGIIRRERSTPLVAAVDGPALGGGLEIVLACDIVVASRAAQFGLPEVQRGLVPTCAGLFRGPRALPLNIARELALGGRPMSAERAYSLGLVNELVEPGRASELATELAQLIASNAPVAVQACLAAINQLEADVTSRGWDLTTAAIEALNASSDPAEGVAAFLEKRKPVWSGR